MGAFTSALMREHAPACWFPLSHADAITGHATLQLAGFADQDLAAARRAAQAFGLNAAYDDPDRLLADLRPDLVTIATRTVGRADLIGRCLRAGVRALHVEKPLCNSMAEWHGLRQRFADESVFITYGALRRHLPIYRAALALAASGELGALREVRVQFGAGALFWTQTHAIDLLLFAAGSRRVTGVQALLRGVEIGTHSHELVTDPVVVSSTLTFDDGLVGVVSQAQGSDFVLGCERGEIAVRADGASADMYRCADGAIYPSFASLTLTMADTPGGTLAPLSHLVDCLDGQPNAHAANRVLRHDMLAGQRIAFAMFQSHQEQSRLVDPQDTADDIVILAQTGQRHA